MSFAVANEGITGAGDIRPSGPRLWRRIARRPVAVIAIAIILVIYMAGILAPWIAPYEFNDADFENRFSGPTWEHPLGTDSLGRDLLSRSIWSAQTTVIISAASVVTGALVLGVTMGLISGYFGGKVDGVIMRTAEIFASVPTILLLLIITSTLKDKVELWFEDIEEALGIDWLVSSGAPSYFLVFGALAIFSWVGIARLVRGQVMSLRENTYIAAAQATGASTPRILFHHLLPNMTNLLLVALTLSLGGAAAAEVGLTFLGIGVQPPHPSFGVMIFEGSGASNVRAHFHVILVPAVFLGMLVISFNILGDQLTDVLSPRRR